MIEEEYRRMFLYMIRRTRKWWDALPERDRQPFAISFDDLPTSAKATAIGLWLDFIEGVGLFHSSVTKGEERRMIGCGCSPHTPKVIEMIERIPGKLWECPGCGSRQIKNMSPDEARKIPYLREHGTLNIRLHSSNRKVIK